MSAITEKTVRELAVEIPGAARVFERLQIDYCCGGNRMLDEACEEAGTTIDRVLEALEAAEVPANERSWNEATLAELIDHIQSTHHVYTRDAIARIPGLLEKVAAKHGGNHPELRSIQATFAGLAAELAMHLMKEEMVLFPYVIRMEEATLAGEPVLPPPFGTVRNPVRMMVNEHDGAGEALRSMRTASNEYAAPAGACASFQALYAALAELEADLHRHIHLENNILFPRALEMEG
jgi:regulator of cell morphogenesis and NO signaling